LPRWKKENAGNAPGKLLLHVKAAARTHGEISFRNKLGVGRLDRADADVQMLC